MVEQAEAELELADSIPARVGGDEPEVGLELHLRRREESGAHLCGGDRDDRRAGVEREGRGGVDAELRGCTDVAIPALCVRGGRVREQTCGDERREDRLHLALRTWWRGRRATCWATRR